MPASRLEMRGPTRGRRAALAMVVLLALATSACTRERKFSAEEFVEEVKQEGVGLTLGDTLVTDDESKELYALTLNPLSALPERQKGGEAEEHGHSGGSLSVYDDNAGAEEGMKACQAAADLLCYRAANIVVILESDGLEAQRLGVAMRRLEED